VLRQGNMTTADLARWFDRPHATVSTWVNDNRRPSGTPGDMEHIFALLDVLENLIARKQGFPVPRMGAKGRKVYLAKVREAVVS
jgi:hypothetical protein